MIRWRLFAVGLGVLSACSSPYPHPCGVTARRPLLDHGGTLIRHAGGRVSVLEVTTSPADAGEQPPRRATVDSFSLQGEGLDHFVVAQPPATGLDFLQSTTDFADGVAIGRMRQAPADGGSLPVVEVTLRDGGSWTAAANPCQCGVVPPRLAQAGELLQVQFPTADGGAELWAFLDDGSVAAQRSLSTGQLMLPGPDAVAVLPGPTLLSPALDPISVTPSLPSGAALLGGGIFSWHLASQRAVQAFATNEDVLLQPFDFTGHADVPIRASSGTFVLAAATTPVGTGLVFGGLAQADVTGLTGLFFAFIDEHGHKLGPDVPMLSEPGQGFLGTATLVAFEGERRFGVFFPTTTSVDYAEVRCE